MRPASPHLRGGILLSEIAHGLRTTEVGFRRREIDRGWRGGLGRRAGSAYGTAGTDVAGFGHGTRALRAFGRLSKCDGQCHCDGNSANHKRVLPCVDPWTLPVRQEVGLQALNICYLETRRSLQHRTPKRAFPGGCFLTHPKYALLADGRRSAVAPSSRSRFARGVAAALVASRRLTGAITVILRTKL